MKQKKTKIFIGLMEIAGYCGSLNDGFRELGIASCFFQYMHNKYYNRGTLFMRCCQVVSSIRQTNKLCSGALLPVDILLRMFVFCWAILFFNVFIYAASSTFFRYKELWLLKKLGKKIIYVFLGTESRPDYLSGNLVNALYLKDDNIENIDECIRKATLKKDTINQIEKFADYCINHPPCAIFHTKPYIKWLYIGFPFSKEKMAMTIKEQNKENDNITILHAPSNPQTKGTQTFREIITKLQREGKNINFIELINQPNNKVLELLGQCDFVVDELYSDIPLGGLGVEAAFAGKPTINGGYYCNYIDKDYSKEVIPPAVFCDPQEIEEKIRYLISDAEIQKRIGQEACEFVTKRWNAKEVASRYLCMINNEVPQEWVGDPYNLNYIYGYGQSKEQLRKVINAILKNTGKDGFLLSDKTDFLDKLLKEC